MNNMIKLSLLLTCAFWTVKCEVTTDIYNFETICHDTVYGDFFSTLHNVRSKASCGLECSRQAQCASFAYNSMTSVCNMNNATCDPSSFGPCILDVTYGERKVCYVVFIISTD